MNARECRERPNPISDVISLELEFAYWVNVQALETLPQDDSSVSLGLLRYPSEALLEAVGFNPQHAHR